jgi:transposase
VTNPTASSANEEIVPSLLAPYWQEVRSKLLALLERESPLPLTAGLCRLAQILEIVRIEQHIGAPQKGGRGRAAIDRRPLARAFLAKAVLDLSSTRQLMEQLNLSPALRSLCGMARVPSEATFSRAFAAFARRNLGDLVHQDLVARFVSGQTVLHISQDATAVEAREKATRKVKQPGKPGQASLTSIKKAWSSQEGCAAPGQGANAS